MTPVLHMCSQRFKAAGVTSGTEEWKYCHLMFLDNTKELSAGQGKIFLSGFLSRNAEPIKAIKGSSNLLGQ